MNTSNPEAEISALKRKVEQLEFEKQDLTAHLEKANRLLDAFKKTGKPPPNKLKLDFPPSRSDNMI